MTAGKVKCIKKIGMNGPTLIKCCPTSKNGYYRAMGASSGGWETLDDIDVEVECEETYGNDYCYEADYAVTNFDCGQL